MHMATLENREVEEQPSSPAASERGSRRNSKSSSPGALRGSPSSSQRDISTPTKYSTYAEGLSSDTGERVRLELPSSLVGVSTRRRSSSNNSPGGNGRTSGSSALSASGSPSVSMQSLDVIKEAQRRASSPEVSDRDSSAPRTPEIVAMPVLAPTPPIVRQPTAIKALQLELQLLRRELADGSCRVELVDCDLFAWEVSLAGPLGTPYYRGNFRFLFHFPHDYPTRPPRIRCITPMFHCNIDQNGTVCLGQYGEAAPILEPAQIAAEEQPPERMHLTVTIVSAKGLRNADALGKSDPYCTCAIIGKSWTKFQTDTIDNTLAPVWNWEHVINDYTHGDALEFTVLDYDEGPDADELLGKGTLSSAQFHPDGFTGDLHLSEAGKGTKASVRVKVAAQGAPQHSRGRTTALDIVKAILSLLLLPVPENALVPSVAGLFVSDRLKHDRLAHEWTLQYAI